MKIRFEKLGEADREAVIDLFNYYIENSFAAYPEKKVPYGLFDQFLALTAGYPAFTVRDDEQGDQIMGFAFLRPYHPFREFQRAAEITYFIEPGYTGKGIGSRILERIVDEAKRKGIDTILANVLFAQRIKPALPRAARVCGVRAIQASGEKEGAGSRRRVDAADPLKNRVSGIGYWA